MAKKSVDQIIYNFNNLCQQTFWPYYIKKNTKIKEVLPELNKIHNIIGHGQKEKFKLLLKNNNFYMEGIDLLIEHFTNNCPICCTYYQSLKLVKNPRIITDEGPHYRYLCDITYLDKKISNNTKYNYIIDFLDHFLNFTGLFLWNYKTLKLLLNIKRYFL